VVTGTTYARKDKVVTGTTYAVQSRVSARYHGGMGLKVFIASLAQGCANVRRFVHRLLQPARSQK
jgi:hypothetical protein